MTENSKQQVVVIELFFFHSRLLEIYLIISATFLHDHAIVTVVRVLLLDYATTATNFDERAYVLQIWARRRFECVRALMFERM